MRLSRGALRCGGGNLKSGGRTKLIALGSVCLVATHRYSLYTIIQNHASICIERERERHTLRPLVVLMYELCSKLIKSALARGFRLVISAIIV